jgi:hypothetical protein
MISRHEKAMLACQNVDGGTWHDINKLAVHAYQIADAMLAARHTRGWLVD